MPVAHSKLHHTRLVGDPIRNLVAESDRFDGILNYVMRWELPISLTRGWTPHVQALNKDLKKGKQYEEHYEM